MTLFDLVVLGLLVLSALVGFIRGATRELITVIAFVLGALAAVFALRFTGPIARDAVNPPWAGNAVAIIIVFLVVYILLRVLGAGITRRIHQTGSLGSIDRAAGVGVGLIRALVLIGVFHLVFHAATPPERLPRWMTNAASYPLSGAAAGALRVVAREGAESADSLGPALKEAVATEPGQADAQPGAPAQQERRP